MEAIANRHFTPLDADGILGGDVVPTSSQEA
jgi:hypothetical protein